VQSGVGPFLAIYLAGYRWNEESVGLALTVGGIAGILTQTPAGGLVDFLRQKRALVVTTQLVVTLLASWSGRKAGVWGRKPLLLIAFGVLPIRAVLYTLTTNTALLVAIQVMDGIAAAVGIGAALSQVIAGSIVHHVSFRAGFLFLALVALAAFAILYFFMPETRNTRLETA
jgi:predicted MFS family arabinose efflux permease